MAARTGLLDGKEPSLLHAYLSVPSAGGAGCRARSWLGTATVTGVALGHGRYADLRFGTACSLFQRDFQIVAKVGATVHLIVCT